MLIYFDKSSPHILIERKFNEANDKRPDLFLFGWVILIRHQKLFEKYAQFRRE